jgi:23S rRNA (cytidine1920-2'-O)/16S rRNA (cytidine1409-2'-O)-methyltransferase
VPVAKASDEIDVNAVVEAAPAYPWVSRAGVKLAAGLDHFHFDPAGCVCIDIGAATGGFTEVLANRGARRVYAVDVGHGQLHQRVRRLDCVTLIERQDIRTLDPAVLPEAPNFVVIDVSFISLEQVIPAATALAQGPARLLALIKPQFEAGRGRVKKGIVRDARIHSEVCKNIAGVLASFGWTVRSVCPSPITGSGGNREFLIGATRD